MALVRFPAGPDDDQQFATFTCWDGDVAKPWAEEAENYIRAFVLRQPETHVLKWCEDGQLIAVVSFGTRVLGLPLLDPVDHTVWHLDVMGVQIDRQGEGIGAVALRETLDVMRARNPDIVLVTADVHRANLPAGSLLAAAEITPLVPKDDDYWIYLGEL